MNKLPEIEIDGVKISKCHKPYFIADIAANHDGELSRAKDLIYLAASAGAHAVKFQHFSAETLVSDEGFRGLGDSLSHQKAWKKSVFEVYQDASLDLSWTAQLHATAKDAGVTFLSTPYSLELAEHINPYVPAFKIGSGDLNHHKLITYVSSLGKPWLLATGASTMSEVIQAVEATGSNTSGVIMQCNTNYTGSPENFRFINLNVLKAFGRQFPSHLLGLSDHTAGHSTVLGAIPLGARVFEKHFTDDVELEGPDHAFSMTPATWAEMVERSDEVFSSLGVEDKKVEDNETDTVILQRRCLRAARDIEPGVRISEDDLIPLRPAPKESIPPNEVDKVIGKTSKHLIAKGSEVTWALLN